MSPMSPIIHTANIAIIATVRRLRPVCHHSIFFACSHVAAVYFYLMRRFPSGSRSNISFCRRERRMPKKVDPTFQAPKSQLKIDCVLFFLIYGPIAGFSHSAAHFQFGVTNTRDALYCLSRPRWWGRWWTWAKLWRGNTGEELMRINWYLWFEPFKMSLDSKFSWIPVACRWLSPQCATTEPPEVAADIWAKYIWEDHK